MPIPIRLRSTPVAAVTAASPPRPMALASAASHRRVCRSSIVGVSKANFCEISATRELSINATIQRLLNSPFPLGFHAFRFPLFSYAAYPERPGTYSNYVTFNDDAMARAMILLDQASKLTPPLDMDLFTSDERGQLPAAIA